MARKEQITCDMCGKQKQDTNHWFLITEGGERESHFVAVSHIGFQESAPNRSWKIYDCCGEACVIKKVSELLHKTSDAK